MQIQFDTKYLKIVLYVALAATLVFVSYNVVFNFGDFLSATGNIIRFSLSIISPLTIGVIIAYLLYPLSKVINNLLRKRLKVKFETRLLSIALTYIAVILSFIILIYSIYAMIGGQISHNENLSVMIGTIGDYIKRYNELYEYIKVKITESGLSINIKDYLSEATKQVYQYLSVSISSIVKISSGIGNGIINGFIGLFISFYLLKDYDYFKKVYFKVMRLIMKESSFRSFNNTIHEINDILSSFIRGQLLDGLIVGIISSIGLYAIRIDFAFLIGFTAGIANVIPYVGPFIGCIPAVIIGVLSPNPMVAVWAVLVLFAVQQIDSAIISPKIVGDTMGLHPVFVMMAIMIGGTLAGIVGMLLSVPVASIIKLFVSKLIAKREEKVGSEI